MRLTVDLTFNGPAVAPAEHETVLTLGELAGTVRHPARLRSLLRDPEITELRVLRDDRALNGVQAGAMLLASLSRAGRFEVRSAATAVDMGPGAMRARAIAALAAALPAELVRSARWLARARRVAASSFSLPDRPPSRTRRITYLRAEPSLRWLGTQVGGAATHTAGVVNGLSSAGLDVTVFAPERPDGVRQAQSRDVPAQHVLQLLHWLTLVGHTHELVDAAVDVPADLVYQRYALGSYAGLELARRLDVPLVLEFNGSEIWAERHWGNGRVPLLRTLAALERRNLLDASLIVVVSQPLKDQLVEEGIAPGRVLVNPNGVDVEALAHARSRPPEHWRSKAGLPQAPTVGFVGTFGLWHGVRLLPELIERVAERRDDARWVLVGDGPLHGEVAAEIERRGLSGRVRLTGVVAHPLAVELLAGCEVCVSPHVPNPDGTAFFGSPTKIFEYMGLGRAIVASDLDQIGEVLDDELTALLTPPGDVPAAASAVVRLLGDGPLRARLGAAALEEAASRYSWDAHVRRILDALGIASAAQRAQSER
ncbi:MAG TPA: glycosyltransferase family 4 protein [Solirubrobacteraceae bacterium]|jgi:glycosyltransferase involved in cell wall biosynthesis|nr:glycosyltransferase family 4 protein [Solirubrobacteraceae bacterium]